MVLQPDRHALSVYAFWQSIFAQSRSKLGIGETNSCIAQALQRSLISSSQDPRDHREGLGLIQPAARVLHTLQH